MAKKRPNLTSAAKVRLAREVFKAALDATETFRERDIGVDLAYLLAQSSTGLLPTWTGGRCRIRRALLPILRAKFPRRHPVWRFISLEGASVPLEGDEPDWVAMESDHLATPADEAVKADQGQCLVVSAPGWFQRKDFRDWRQGQRPQQTGPPASWNIDHPDDEFADVFMTFDRGESSGPFWEGSDADALPGDIFGAIGQLLEERQLRHGLIWLKPV